MYRVSGSIGSGELGPEISLNGRSRAQFVGFRGRERASIFFKRGREMEYIRRGMKFQRVKPDKSVETAQVLSVAFDSHRIPHVRYELSFKRPSRAAAFKDGPRLLSLSAFTKTYRDRVRS